MTGIIPPRDEKAKQENLSAEYHHQFVDVAAMHEDLLRRAAELLRTGKHGDGTAWDWWQEERKKWFHDAGMEK